MKPAIRSERAEADIVAAVAFYLTEAAHMLDAFLDALERATGHIENHPASGSPRYAHELDIPQLRHWTLRRFPYAMFYIEHADHLDVIRIAHTSRDIPASLHEATP
ncbi:MAG: type II toxin-antitoxin system RelE/ParE family toxin [Proteobacteria bacterium]|nr:type II toxin-antitoxin system RelE/ParE family toxin [Pseudomonadota bacterium]